MAMTSESQVAVKLRKILNEAGNKNFPRPQGSWGRFQKECEILTNCGWKMGMCKSSSGKDNAINRMYSTGVIRSYPEALIQCLFVDDFIEELSEVYRSEFGSKMRCSPILIFVTEDDKNNWGVKRIMVQDHHPMMPLTQRQVTAFFPNKEVECIETVGLIPTGGWASDNRFAERCLDHEWGEIIILTTGTNSDGFYTEIQQSCRNQSCVETRKGVVQGNIEWQPIPW